MVIPPDDLIIFNMEPGINTYVRFCCDSGKSFEYDNAEGIKTYILELFKKFSEGIYTIEQKNITQYNVKNQVKKLSDLLHQITESNQHKNEK